MFQPCDGQRYSFRVSTLSQFSKFAEGLLLNADLCDSEDVVLSTERGGGAALQAVATWVRRHESVAPSRVAMPMASVPRVEDLYSDGWDLQLLQHVAAAVNNQGPPLPSMQKLYNVALLSSFLQLTPLTLAVGAYFSFHIRACL